VGRVVQGVSALRWSGVRRRRRRMHGRAEQSVRTGRPLIGRPSPRPAEQSATVGEPVLVHGRVAHRRLDHGDVQPLFRVRAQVRRSPRDGSRSVDRVWSRARRDGVARGGFGSCVFASRARARDARRAAFALHASEACGARRSSSRSRDATRCAKTRWTTSPRRVEARRFRPRTLEAIAMENAVEGCARETFGAVVAMWQATHAGDVDVRHALKRIAPDELGHAALAWTIAAWIEQRLDTDAATRIHRARDAALAELTKRVVDPPREVARTLGTPSSDEMRVMTNALVAALRGRCRRQ
jgi:hypothetical protein